MSGQFSNSLIKLGCVDYINALPLYYGGILSFPSVDLWFGKPSELLSRFLTFSPSNRNITPSEVFLTGSTGTFLPSAAFLPTYGIAAYKNILSVNLYAKPSLFSYSSTLSKIAITKESCASVALLQVLCNRLWKINPKFISTSTEILLQNYSQYDGILLIGDTALKNQIIQGLVTYDLANAWYELTRLPFVFACFLLSPNFSQKKLLESFLDTSLKFFEQDPALVLARAKQKTLLPIDYLKRYYSHCQYRLGKEELRGLDTFRKYYEELSSSNHLTKPSALQSR
ncbi:menaquinone biosynthesis protein [Chlamydiifrater volucris]|uniref:menaquinone biosynthesis protein n=1 Tax=Chlamydiifrater volucris TaxID=2681470 RepID=UPI0032B1BA02